MGDRGGYIPSESSFSNRELISHETACILNAGERDAHVAVFIFFADREPTGPYRVTVPPRRTLHLRFNDLVDPEPYLATRTIRRCSNPTNPSSCNTRDWIPATPR